MTNDLNNLSSFLPYEGIDALHIGNGTSMPIQHIGSSTLSFANSTFLLHDVLYVLTFTKKMLSLSKLLRDNSILIEFCSNICVIKECHTLRILLQVTITYGLYMVTLSSFSSPRTFLGE